MFAKLVFTSGCLLLPVLWGVLINWLIDVWQDRSTVKGDDEPVFPDYQI